MKYGDYGLSDPIEEAFETQPLETERQRRSLALRQVRRVNPYPQVSQDQAKGYKHQPQARVSRAGVNACLPQLAIARFDAKALAVALADLGRRTMHPPGSEEQLLLYPFFVFAIAVGAIGHADLERYLAFAVLQSVCIPASVLAFDPVQTGRDAFLLGPTAAEHHGQQEGEILMLQVFRDGDVEEGAIQQQTLDFQAKFADPRQQAPQGRDRRFVASHPCQRDRVALPILHDARRGIGMKFRGALARLAVVDLVAALVRLTVVRHQVPIDGHRPQASLQAARPGAQQRPVQTPLENLPGSRQAVVQTVE